MKDDAASYLASTRFSQDFIKIVQVDTWDKVLPKFCMDENGWLVEHWQNGTVNKLKKLK